MGSPLTFVGYVIIQSAGRGLNTGVKGQSALVCPAYVIYWLSGLGHHISI